MEIELENETKKNFNEKKKLNNNRKNCIMKKKKNNHKFIINKLIYKLITF